MKVTYETRERLTLETDSSIHGLGFVAFGLIFIIGGLIESPVQFGQGIGLALFGIILGAIGFFALFVTSTLTLDRSSSQITLRHRKLRGSKVASWPLDQLNEAIVQTSNSGDEPAYRPALVIGQGRHSDVHPVTQLYLSGHGAEHATLTINRWLDSHRPST